MQILKRFVVLEGIDGAGTTTQLKLVSGWAEKSGVDCCTDFEPTERPLGKMLRKILAGKKKADPHTIALLFAADRSEHVYGQNGILEHTQNGKMQVCDRYLFSSLAYQSIDTDLDWVHGINSRFPLPEYLVYLNVPIAETARRLEGRTRRDIYEYTEFQKKLKRSYDAVLDRFSYSGMKIRVIDGTQSVEKIHEEIASILITSAGN